jgi:curved DNA-binding protein CbpA
MSSTAQPRSQPCGCILEHHGNFSGILDVSSPASTSRNSVSRMMKLKKSYISSLKSLLLIGCLCCQVAPNFWDRVVVVVHAQTVPPECPHTTTDMLYEWESLDFYELLGLKTPPEGNSKNRRRRKGTPVDTRKIDSKDIRKAYRRQAQLWHPDKVSQSSSNDTSTTRISTEESNARFAKIAQAYEILMDPEKRQEYDSFLEYCERIRDDSANTKTARSSSQLRKKFSKVWENIRDPFQIFEDFFFGSNQNDEDLYGGDNFDPNDPFSFLQYHHHQQQQHRQRYRGNDQHYQKSQQDRPARIFQGKENLYDPMTGEAVLRVTQTEEFTPPQDSYTGRFYYRIIAQDFKQRYDPYTTGLKYVPITDPYLQEEGYRYQSSRNAAASSTQSPNMESLLHSWEVMTPESKLLVSPNHRFVAGLSPDDCELLIMVDNPYDDVYRHYRGHLYGKDDVFWSSGREQNSPPFGKSHQTNGGSNSCFAVLKGPHLIVARGDPQGFGNRIMWYSKSGLEEDEADGSKSSHHHSYYEYEDQWGFWHRRPRSYLAQLDDDGSLTIYSVWSVPTNPNQGALSKLMMTVKDLYYGRVPAHAQYGHLYYQSTSPSSSSTSSQIIYRRCIYSTSPVGCFRLGRRLAQLSVELYFRIKSVISKMNHVADTWLDLIYEEDDIFYSIKESIWKNGHAFGSKMASSSARFVRKVMEYFVQEERSRGW